MHRDMLNMNGDYFRVLLFILPAFPVYRIILSTVSTSFQSEFPSYCSMSLKTFTAESQLSTFSMEIINVCVKMKAVSMLKAIYYSQHM
jgi:hypothetical protein